MKWSCQIPARLPVMLSSSVPPELSRLLAAVKVTVRITGVGRNRGGVVATPSRVKVGLVEIPSEAITVNAKLTG